MVKITGFLNHVRMSTNPRCHQEPESHADDSDLSDTESITSQGSVSDSNSKDTAYDDPFLLQSLHSPVQFGPDSAYASEDEETTRTGIVTPGPSLAIDPVGDFYGEYDLLDVGTDLGEDLAVEEEATHWLEGDVTVTDDNSLWDELEDEDAEGVEVYQAQLEHGLEPERLMRMDTEGYEEDTEAQLEADLPNLATRANRDSVEAKLQHRPFVTRFPGLAGASNVNRTTTAHAAYAKSVNQGTKSTNVYAPFSSRLEWDIARWAKLRGPSSTSFTELVSIPGVCFVYAYLGL